MKASGPEIFLTGNRRSVIKCLYLLYVYLGLLFLPDSVLVICVRENDKSLRNEVYFNLRRFIIKYRTV